MRTIDSTSNAPTLNTECKAASAVNDTPTTKVLVVEDDPDLSVLIARVMREIDPLIKVRMASSVDEATLCLDEEGSFDLILADYMLADSRNGYELRELCLEKSPTSNFAMMSSMPLDFPDVPEGSFLQKPFSPTEAMQFIERRLEN